MDVEEAAKVEFRTGRFNLVATALHLSDAIVETIYVLKI
jgi:hypothetical protein